MCREESARSAGRVLDIETVGSDDRGMTLGWEI